MYAWYYRFILNRLAARLIRDRDTADGTFWMAYTLAWLREGKVNHQHDLDRLSIYIRDVYHQVGGAAHQAGTERFIDALQRKERPGIL